MDKLSENFEDLSVSDCSSSNACVRGTCTTMCPDEEVEYRRRAKLIHPLEATPETAALNQHQRRCDRHRMVKCYSRPAAGKDLSRPNILRPFPILKTTVDYLLKLTSTCTFSWDIIYGFIVDRFRSIRQDIIIQGSSLRSYEIMALLRPMLLFYFYSKYRCDTDGCSSYDSHLHKCQLDECVDRYFVALTSDSQDNGEHPRQDIVRCLLFYRLKSSLRFTDLLLLSSSIHKDILRLGHLYHQANFVRFFRLFIKLPLQERLALSAGIDIGQFRRQSLRTMQKAYGRSKVPVGKISEWLGFKSIDDATSCLEDCGYQVNEAGLVEFIVSGLEVTKRDSSHWHRWADDGMTNYAFF